MNILIMKDMIKPFTFISKSLKTIQTLITKSMDWEIFSMKLEITTKEQVYGMTNKKRKER